MTNDARLVENQCHSPMRTLAGSTFWFWFQRADPRRRLFRTEIAGHGWCSVVDDRNRRLGWTWYDEGGLRVTDADRTTVIFVGNSESRRWNDETRYPVLDTKRGHLGWVGLVEGLVVRHEFASMNPPPVERVWANTVPGRWLDNWAGPRPAKPREGGELVAAITQQSWNPWSRRYPSVIYGRDQVPLAVIWPWAHGGPATRLQLVDNRVDGILRALVLAAAWVRCVQPEPSGD